MNDITEQQVQDKVAQYRATLQSRRLEGLDLEAVLDLDATARRALQAQSSQDDDEPPLVVADTHGFLHLAYTIHLSPMAVLEFTTAADAISGALKDAIADVPEIDVISIPLVAYIMSESGSIEAVAQASESGAVRLDGIFPSPFPFPTPEDPDYWKIAGADLRTADDEDSPDDHEWPEPNSGYKDPGDIWDANDA